MELVHAIHQTAQLRPKAPALVSANHTLSYQQLVEEVESLAARINDWQCSRLALLSDNSPAWVVVDLASQLADITLIPLPIFFTPAQMLHALDDGQIDTLLTDQAHIAQRLGMHPLTESVECIAGTALWRIVLAQAETKSPIAKVTYTSGTTGNPKGVCLGTQQMTSVAAALAERLEVTNTDRHLCLLPLAVLLENIGGVYVPLLKGASCMIPSLSSTGISGSSGLDIEQLYRTLCEYQPTTVILLPQMLQALVEFLEQGHALPDSLRLVAVGGAPVSATLLQRAKAVNIPAFEGYGLSECSSVVAVNTPGQHKTGSVGKPLPHNQLKFADDGEILLRGNLFDGYLNQPGSRPQGWYASGDLGYLDDEGYLFLTGRKKNIFITAFGRNVAPEWVERELTIQTAIAQAVVFGEARPFNVAILVPRPGISKTQLQQAVDQANQQLPDYAQISAWILAKGPFTLANQQFTATGRPRREAIWQHYQTTIEQIYLEQGSQPKEAL